MNIKNTAAGLILAGSALLPSQAQAEDHSAPHAHHHHLAFGVDADAHKTLSSILYTREVMHHWSVGAAIGLGADYHGKFAGGVEAIGTFHKTISKPFFVVGEVGAGAELVGSSIDPIIKITGLVGVQVNDVLGVSVGPSVFATRGNIQPAATAHLAVGF